MYFSFVSTSTRPSYAVAISLIAKLYGKDGNDHRPVCRPVRMISRRCDTALRYASHCCFDNAMGTLADITFYYISQIFHAMRQVLKLPPELCESLSRRYDDITSSYELRT